MLRYVQGSVMAFVAGVATGAAIVLDSPAFGVAAVGAAFVCVLIARSSSGDWQ